MNLQLNRSLSWMTPQASPDVAGAADGARGHADLTARFLALGERLLILKRLLDVAFCFRVGDFFLMRPHCSTRSSAHGRGVTSSAVGESRKANMSSASRPFASIARCTTAHVSPLVRADLLLLAGVEDHYVPF